MLFNNNDASLFLDCKNKLFMESQSLFLDLNKIDTLFLNVS